MTRSTTALQRRIETETAAAAQAERDDRLAAARAGRPHLRALPVWAVDSLLRSGVASAAQHDAARRYRSVIERSQEGYAPPLRASRYADPDAGGNAPDFAADAVASAWDRVRSLTAARTARSWCLRALSRYPSGARTLDRLFAFDGASMTGPLPTFAAMRLLGKGRLPMADAQAQCLRTLAALELHWQVMDRSYGL